MLQEDISSLILDKFTSLGSFLIILFVVPFLFAGTLEVEFNGIFESKEDSKPVWMNSKFTSLYPELMNAKLSTSVTNLRYSIGSRIVELSNEVPSTSDLR